MRKFAIAMLVVVFLVGSVHAAGMRGTAPEAIKMVEKAVALIVSEGGDKAFKEISNSKGPFVDRDLYVFVVDLKGVVRAHSGDPSMVGKNMLDTRDMDGKAFIRDLIRQARVKDTGWIDYKWPHPITGQIESQSRYYHKIGDFIVTCGIYYLQADFET
jgi:signal transduction histidine kinase